MKQLTIFLALLLFSLLGNSQENSFIKHAPCSFSIDLPLEMEIKKMYDDSNPDYCDYEVKLDDGYLIMELHSLVISRFEHNTITELYNAAIKSSELKITYKMRAADYFVISGINEENGNIIYWKRVLGENFVSDMRIEYSENRKTDIEQYIAEISKSFTSD